MKTQVIQLDSHDDVTSVCDRMSWAKTERILLVFPRRSRIVGRTLDLLLLKRHAATLGAQLAIVARSTELRLVAEGLGIPAFATAASAQPQVWEMGKAPSRPLRRHDRPDLRHMRREAFPPEAHWRSLIGFRLSIFSLAVLAIFVVLSLFIPSATIHLNPAIRLQSLKFTVSASPNVTIVNLAGSLPARLTALVVEHSKTIQTSGSIAIPEALAQGQARFRNLTTALTIVPVGMVISTLNNPPVRFVTTKEAVVPALFGKTVDIPIQAVDAGSTGNLPPDTLVAIEGELGTRLGVTNPAPTTGGTDRNGAIQTTSDRSIVNKALVMEILEECYTSLQQTLTPGDIYFPDTLAVSQVLSETYFPAEGQSSDTLSLTIRLQCQMQYASQTDVNALAEMSLDANLPVGFAPSPGGLEILLASILITDTDGITRWEVQAQRLLHARLDPFTVQQLALGRRPYVAVLRLNKSMLLAGSPVIQIKPGWWPWLPLVPFRIAVSTGG